MHFLQLDVKSTIFELFLSDFFSRIVFDFFPRKLLFPKIIFPKSFEAFFPNFFLGNFSFEMFVPYFFGFFPEILFSKNFGEKKYFKKKSEKKFCKKLKRKFRGKNSEQKIWKNFKKIFKRKLGKQFLEIKIFEKKIRIKLGKNEF